MPFQKPELVLCHRNVNELDSYTIYDQFRRKEVVNEFGNARPYIFPLTGIILVVNPSFMRIQIKSIKKEKFWKKKKKS